MSGFHNCQTMICSCSIHWGRAKMATILQTTLLCFDWNVTNYYSLRFIWQQAIIGLENCLTQNRQDTIILTTDSLFRSNRSKASHEWMTNVPFNIVWEICFVAARHIGNWHNTLMVIVRDELNKLKLLSRMCSLNISFSLPPSRH